MSSLSVFVGVQLFTVLQIALEDCLVNFLSYSCEIDPRAETLAVVEGASLNSTCFIGFQIVYWTIMGSP